MTKRYGCGGNPHPQGISRRSFLGLAATAGATGLLTGCSPVHQPMTTSTSEPAAVPTNTPTAEPVPVLTATATPLPAYWPTAGWQTSTPEQQGMDSERLARMFEFIETQGLNVHSLSIVRNGYVVVDACIHPFVQSAKHIIHSAAKSITSALVGIAIDKGYIEGVNQLILDFFPGRTVAHLDSSKQAMTLEHALTMSAGLACDDSVASEWRTFTEMTRSPDWVQYMLDLPMAEEPGTRFEYCNGVSLLLSAIVQETTGMSALAFAEEHLFGPLGISDVVWLSTPRGVTAGYGRLWMRPDDMAKIGYLYLHNGLWDGEQTIPSAWVETSTRRHISPSPGEGYGYQWWIEDPDTYVADGYAGQRMIVVFLGEHSLELPIGLDAVHRMTYIDQPALITSLDGTTWEADIERITQANGPGFAGGPVALKGSWRNDNTFVIYVQTVGWHDRLELSLAFDEGGVDIWERAYKRGTSRLVRGTLEPKAEGGVP